MGPDLVETTTKLLSRHLFKAQFQEIKTSPVMVKIYPPPPAKKVVSFKVTEYKDHRKYGQYGDEKKNVYMTNFESLSESRKAMLKKLKQGDNVLIGYDHNYVTKMRNYPVGHGKRTEKGFSTSAPDRI